MSLRDDLAACTPKLRRYARALATGSPGSSTFADDIVHAALIRALGARQIGSTADLAIRLFATVTQLHRDSLVATQEARAAGAGSPSLALARAMPSAGPTRGSRLSAALMQLSLEEREALLLVVLEGFDHTDAARILRISRQTLIGRLTGARCGMDRALGGVPEAPRPARRGRDVPYLRLVT